jgi:hypothetical protein
MKVLQMFPDAGVEDWENAYTIVTQVMTHAPEDITMVDIVNFIDTHASGKSLSEIIATVHEV